MAKALELSADSLAVMPSVPKASHAATPTVEPKRSRPSPRAEREPLQVRWPVDEVNRKGRGEQTQVCDLIVMKLRKMEGQLGPTPTQRRLLDSGAFCVEQLELQAVPNQGLRSGGKAL